MEKIFLTDSMVETMVSALAQKLQINHVFSDEVHSLKLYPATDGAIPLLYLLKQRWSRLDITRDPEEADVVVDLCYDTGSVCRAWHEQFPSKAKSFYVLIDKAHEPSDFKGKWVVFPWEIQKTEEVVLEPRSIDQVMNENVISQLLFNVIGEQPRGGLVDTPSRVVKAWKEWTAGYGVDVKALLKTFDDGGDNYDQMVIVKDIPIYSHCEHHLAAIFGTCTIAYIPDGKIVGLSKLSRLADVFSRRLQVQERITSQIADALFDNLAPKGVGVLIKARHMCMESRGIRQQGHITITSALRGCIKNEADTKAEFMKLAY